MKQGREFDPDINKINLGSVQASLALELRMPMLAHKIINNDVKWERESSRSQYLSSLQDSQAWPPILTQLHREAEFWTRLIGQPIKLNKLSAYSFVSNQDYLGWQTISDSPIVIISLGGAREVWFREKPSDDPLSTKVPDNVKIKLPTGSILVVPPTNHQYKFPQMATVDESNISLIFS